MRAAFSSILLLSLLACEPSVPAGKIRVKNDSQDREYNVLRVSGGGNSCTLNPGQSCLLPRGTSKIEFSRAYRDFTRYYTVSCPPLGERGITMKLIDVHLNRIAGGCKTVSASK